MVHFSKSCTWYHLLYCGWDRQGMQHICRNWKMYTKLSFSKLSMLTLTPTKHPAPQTPSSRVKHPGHEADDSHPSNANIKDKWTQNSIQLYAFVILYLRGVQSLGRPMHRWDIKINLKQTGLQDVRWNNLAQDRNLCGVLVDVVMNLFHKLQRIYWLANQLLASQGLHNTKFVSCFIVFYITQCCGIWLRDHVIEVSNQFQS